MMADVVNPKEQLPHEEQKVPNVENKIELETKQKDLALVGGGHL